MTCAFFVTEVVDCTSDLVEHSLKPPLGGLVRLGGVLRGCQAEGNKVKELVQKALGAAEE